MSGSIALWLIGLLASTLLVVTGARCWLAEHDRQVLQERRIAAAPQSSGGGCLALLLLAAVAALAAWVCLGPGL